jgi:ATP-dependent DNA helicase RecG
MTVVFYKDKWTEENLKKIGLSERQIIAVTYIKENEKITNKEYQGINDCSRNTATNDLRDLIKKHVLKESGKRGAGSYYVIAQ